MVDSKQQWKAWIYLLPTIVLILIFTVWPIINTVRIAFLEDYSPLGAVGGETYHFGFKNFVNAVSFGEGTTFFEGIAETFKGNGRNVGFIACLTNTILLTFLTVPLSTLLALLISVFLNNIPKFSKLFQTIYFLPYVTNSIAIGMVFAMMFNIVGISPDGTQAQSWGIVNNVIQFFGGQPINWMNQGSNYWANIAVIVIYIIWNALPFKILILLGGLQSVNKQYYEAAKIDSASRGTVFWRITVPLLSPMIAYVIITGFIGGFKEYTSIVGIFGDTMGPVGRPESLNTMVGYIYGAIDKDNYGLASASALILFCIIMVVTFINLYVSNKKVHY